MADQATGRERISSLRKIFRFLRLERHEVFSIYFYALLSGLIQLSLPLGIQYIINFVLGGSFSASMIVLIFLVVMGVFLAGLFQINQMKIIEKIQQKIFVRYAFAFSERVPRFDPVSVDQYYLPELMNRFFDTVSLQKGVSKLLLEIPTALIQIFFGLMLLSFYHPVFIFFGLLVLLVLYVLLYYTGAAGLSTSISESNYKYKVAAWMEEIARVVNIFKFSKNNNLHITRTDKEVSNYLKARTQHFRILLSQYWSLVGFKILITATMLIVGSLLLVQQELNIGQFIAAEIVILSVLSSVEKLISNLDKVYDVMTSFEKLDTVIDKPLEQHGTMLLPDKGGLKIETQNVSFTYPDGKKILSGVSFKAMPGEKIYITGPEGSGKTTLLRLLSGSYSGYTGNIVVNDLPIGNYEGDSLRHHISMVSGRQDIFEGTIAENILMGDTSVGTDEIMKLAEMLRLKEFLQALPQGLDTWIDPGGRRLPGTIVHRMVLLRALLGKPSLLLLEDNSAGLAEYQGDKVTGHLLNAGDQITMIMTGNNLSLARQCDRILYLRDGQLIADGSWNEIKDIIG
jgi:ATP-binding cassette, subfamily B, bacterial